MKLKFKHNPCEKHTDVETDDDWCPCCLMEERDAARAERDAAQENAAKLAAANRSYAISVCPELDRAISELKAERDAARKVNDRLAAELNEVRREKQDLRSELDQAEERVDDTKAMSQVHLTESKWLRAEIEQAKREIYRLDRIGEKTLAKLKKAQEDDTFHVIAYRVALRHVLEALSVFTNPDRPPVTHEEWDMINKAAIEGWGMLENE